MENMQALEKEFESEGWLLREKDIRFGKVLGKGAAGITYEGDYEGRKVAIKTYSVSILKKDFISVRNEITLLPKMVHPNIIGFVGICFKVEPLAAALVMIFAPNGDLNHAMYETRVFSRDPRLRYRVAIGLARGLEHLHKHNIIHRDIKPANVLLSDKYETLLTDFGFSRLIDTDGRMTGETGSYKYMAPEVIRHGPYSEKADVYGFAVVVNELFVGDRPYEYMLPLHAAMGVVKKNMRPSQKRIRCERLKLLIQRCWDVDPKARPEWPEVLQELEKARIEDDSTSLLGKFMK